MKPKSHRKRIQEMNAGNECKKRIDSRKRSLKHTAQDEGGVRCPAQKVHRSSPWPWSSERRFSGWSLPVVPTWSPESTPNPTGTLRAVPSSSPRSPRACRDSPILRRQCRRRWFQFRPPRSNVPAIAGARIPSASSSAPVVAIHARTHASNRASNRGIVVAILPAVALSSVQMAISLPTTM